MSKRDIVVIGASAGGVEALKQLASQLPEDFPAAVLIVLHVSPHGHSVLPTILSRVGPLKAVHPLQGQAIERGRIYVAPPDQNLLVKPDYINLARGPRENGHRPAVDPLFRSAARSYGQRVIGIVLSGVLDDGTAGLLAIKMRNGLAIVQHPEDALYPGMPQSAIENVNVDYIVPISEMPDLLMELVQQDVPEDNLPAEGSLLEIENEIMELDMATIHEHHPGRLAALACPDCGGTLWEIQEGELVRFRCRVGHAFSAQTLLAEQDEALEEAFWVAFRALEESAALSRRMAEQATKKGRHHSAQQFEERAKSAEQRAELIRSVLLNGISQPQTDDLFPAVTDTETR
jgi:two-component system, chemotaxis family, protein-glutamate methylesterase/glutaminase